MSPLTKEYIKFIRREESFSIYEAAMLWLGAPPLDRSLMDQIIRSEKPSGYYSLCRKMLNDIRKGDIHPEDVMPQITAITGTEAGKTKDGRIVLEEEEYKQTDYPSYKLNVGGRAIIMPRADSVPKGKTKFWKSNWEAIRKHQLDPYRTTVRRKAFAKWALNSKMDPPQFLENEIKDEKKNENLKKLRPVQRHKLNCIEAAKKIWKEHPDMTIAWMIERRKEIYDAIEGENYHEKTIRKWINKYCPNRRPGRRPQK